jgi:hypothetical protein
MSFRDKVFNKYLNNDSNSEQSISSYNSLNESDILSISDSYNSLADSDILSLSDSYNSLDDSKYTNNDTCFNIDNISDSYCITDSNVELQSISDLFALSDSDSDCNLIDSNIQNNYVKKYHKKESFIHLLFNLIKKIFKVNKKKNKIGKGNNNEINYQYDISDLVNQVK